MHYWDQDTAIVFRLYDQMVAGRGYPFGRGAYMDQPIRLLAAFDLIDVCTAELAENK